MKIIIDFCHSDMNTKSKLLVTKGKFLKKRIKSGERYTKGVERTKKYFSCSSMCISTKFDALCRVLCDYEIVQSPHTSVS